MKIVRFLLLPILAFLFSVTLLDAMKRDRELKSQDDGQDSKQQIAGQGPLVIRNNYDTYPNVARLLLFSDLLCEKLEGGNDLACFHVLPREVLEQIKTKYILISRQSLLDDLIEWGIISQDVLDNEEQLKGFITQLIVEQEYLFLEVLLNAMRRNRDNLVYSVIAHDRLAAMVSKLVQVKHQDVVEKYFATLPDGTLKMALRFVYAVHYEKNLDEYDCVALFCPRLVRSCLTMVSEPCDETANICFLRWHIKLTNNSLCTQAMIPTVFSLIQPTLNRLYPGNMPNFPKMVSFKSIDLSDNEYDATPWSYLLPKQVQIKSVENLGRFMWSLGEMRLMQEPALEATLFD